MNIHLLDNHYCGFQQVKNKKTFLGKPCKPTRFANVHAPCLLKNVDVSVGSGLPWFGQGPQNELTMKNPTEGSLKITMEIS